MLSLSFEKNWIENERFYAETFRKTSQGLVCMDVTLDFDSMIRWVLLHK